MKELHPVVKHLRTHWDREFSLHELVLLGFGTKAQVHYALNATRYVTKVKRGYYQFTPWYKKNALTCRQGILEHLQANPKSSLQDLMTITKCSEKTVRKALSHLVNNKGMKIKSERVYTLEN